MVDAPPPGQQAHPGRTRRLGFLLLGHALLGIGIIGALVPVLPTTPFLILAAGCYTRASPRLEAWLLDHPRFGPALRDWRAHGAIAPRAKRAALIGMTTGFALFWFFVRPGWPLALAVLALMGVGATYVLSRPGGAPGA